MRLKPEFYIKKWTKDKGKIKFKKGVIKMVEIYGKKFESFNRFKSFIDCKISSCKFQNNVVSVRYLIEEWSSVWFYDKYAFDVFPVPFKVKSGAWYVNDGRWRALKRIEREILFSNITKYKTATIHSKNDESEKIIIKKNFLKSLINVEIRSNEFNLVKFKCSSLDSSDFFKLFLYENFSKNFKDVTDLFIRDKENELVFVGKKSADNDVNDLNRAKNILNPLSK